LLRRVATVARNGYGAVVHLQRLLPRFRPRAEHRPRSATRPDGVSVRWLGTAGHVIEHGGTTLLIDPFLSRTGLLATAASPLRPDADSFWHHLPPRITGVLLGHSHYDHLLDAPEIARRSGALVVGSASTAAFARAGGVDEALIVTVPPAGLVTRVGEAEVRFVPSLHGRLLAGRVPFPGEVRGAPPLPARVWNYRMGGAFGVHVTIGGVSIYHNGSANLIDAQLEGLSADVVLLGLAGRRGTPGYVERVIGLLRPRLVVPTHHDAFFAPLEQGVRLLPGIDLPGFCGQASRSAPQAAIITPTYDDVLVVPIGAPASESVLVGR
jgi:L-ascorbate metabolism protein UlaG (beta-lactamase superfamily)